MTADTAQPTTTMTRFAVLIEGPAGLTAGVLQEALEIASRRAGGPVRLVSQPMRGARVKAPVRPLHRAPTWPPRAAR